MRYGSRLTRESRVRARLGPSGRGEIIRTYTRTGHYVISRVPSYVLFDCSGYLIKYRKLYIKRYISGNTIEYLIVLFQLNLNFVSTLPTAVKYGMVFK